VSDAEKSIGVMYRTRKVYPEDCELGIVRDAKMRLGEALIDKIIELQGDKHLKVRVEQGSIQVKTQFPPIEETETVLYCYYREYESVDEIYNRLQSRINELAKWNSTLADVGDDLRAQVIDLESENKALRLIANSHSMSELRRLKIMHPIADQALANDDEQDDIAMARGGRIDE
jgi:hypothetical protein